jgi:hypothetical protein
MESYGQAPSAVGLADADPRLYRLLGLARTLPLLPHSQNQYQLISRRCFEPLTDGYPSLLSADAGSPLEPGINIRVNTLTC